MKNLSFALIIFMLLLSTVGGVFAQSPDGEVLAELDFDNGRIPRDLETTENWSVEKSRGDTYLHTEVGEGGLEYIFLPDGTEWSNYAVEARIRVVGGLFVISTRIPDLDNLCGGYSVTLTPNEDIYMFSYSADCEVTDIATSRDSIPDDEWVTVRFEATGKNLALFVDGEEVASGSDDFYNEGFPAFIVFDQSEADIDYIRVTQIEGAAVVSLREFAGDPKDAVAELVDLDLVPNGGQLLFQEDNAFFQGSGAYFTALARRNPRTNIVMAGELTFDAGAPGEFEVCSLFSRITTDNQGTAVEFINVAISSDGGLVIVDVPEAGENATTIEFQPLGLDLDDPHHLLIVVIGEEISVFVDGELVFDRVPVVERQGTFGIALNSQSRSSRCEGNDIWVYQFD